MGSTNYCPSCNSILPPGEEPRNHMVAYMPFTPAEYLLGKIRPVLLPCWVAQYNTRINQEHKHESR